MCAPFGDSITEQSSTIGLEQFDESVRQAETGPTCPETRYAILAGGLGAEQLCPAFLRGGPVGHRHLQSINPFQHASASKRILSGCVRLTTCQNR
jgi:hypothetical protein